jgi:hypothetical protein
MGSAIAQIVKVRSGQFDDRREEIPMRNESGQSRSHQFAKNKNGNARTAGAIRVFPFRFDKDILKIISMQREFRN